MRPWSDPWRWRLVASNDLPIAVLIMVQRLTPSGTVSRAKSVTATSAEMISPAHASTCVPLMQPRLKRKHNSVKPPFEHFPPRPNVRKKPNSRLAKMRKERDVKLLGQLRSVRSPGVVTKFSGMKAAAISPARNALPNFAGRVKSFGKVGRRFI
jgi:hypothetical protein